MATRSCEMLASQDQPDKDDDRITSPSKEVRSDLNTLTLNKILGTMESLATTMASRQADAFRRQDEKTERMIAEVIAVSRESERCVIESELRTMNTLRTVLDRQSDLEAEMYSVDERETVIDNPAPSRWSSPRQGLGFPLAYLPPASDPQDDFRFLTPPPILRRSERLRHLQEKNVSQSYRED